jgi:outer membrane protein OmpA-like peptidoglycan-associated protein
MKCLTNIRKMILACFGLFLLIIPGAVPGAEDCTKADELFEKSTRQIGLDAQRSLLKEALRLCPSHAKASNNLGTIYEAEGRLAEAKHAFRSANEYDPNLGAPLAGLGDVAMKQGRFQEAAHWYEKFLQFLSVEKQKGDPRGLRLYEAEYRAKYEKAKLKQQILEDSMSGVVPSEQLTRGLKIMTVDEEVSNSLGPERLSLYIYFDFDSTKLKARGRDQLIEMAQTMRSAQNRDRIFMIEGHSDTLGSEAYNLKLSRHRAEAVRSFLVSQGIVADRLRVKGIGEARPLVSSGDSETQALNRRVEFLRLGSFEN